MINKKVLILSGYFKQGLGYQENIWAEQLAQKDYTIRVLAAGRTMSPPKRIRYLKGSYEVERVTTKFLPKAIYLSSHVGPAIKKFNPQLILWMGIGQYFGLPLIKDPRLADIPMITFFSENLGMHEFDWRKRDISWKQRFYARGYQLIRGRIVRAACQKSTLIIGNYLQTRKCLLLLFDKNSERDKIGNKIVDMPLGFNPDNFNFNVATRLRVRNELGFAPEDVVICLSSRFASGRKYRILKNSFRGLQLALQHQPKLKVLVVGMTNNSTSEYFRKLIREGPCTKNFVCHNFSDQARLNMLYNAADIGLFGNATISCQGALGTGLYVCFADNGSMNNLIKLPNQGTLFHANDCNDLAEKLIMSANSIANHTYQTRDSIRAQSAKNSRWLGYDRIIESILTRIEGII